MSVRVPRALHCNTQGRPILSADDGDITAYVVPAEQEKQNSTARTGVLTGAAEKIRGRMRIPTSPDAVCVGGGT
jgi:hypothetical protein